MPMNAEQANEDPGAVMTRLLAMMDRYRAKRPVAAAERR
jgi:hypothetical protein